MTKRYPVSPAPGPLEDYAECFDDLFGARAQRHSFRRYLEGLLLAEQRNKTLTALANTEPVVGAQRKEAQSLQWFLSESRWDPEQMNRRRVKLMLEDTKSVPSAEGVLVIDEHGDRKWGKHTAHVGRQWLANLGKTESGVVSVSSLWVDEGVYWPVNFEPYTPAHHFEGGKEDPKFRTKLKIAKELVEQAVEESIPFRAVVADSFYGEDEDLKWALRELRVGYVLALKPSHSWLHREGEEIGALWEAAEEAGWEDQNDPGQWVEVVRRFRDGHEQVWWALEVDVGPYAPERAQRAIVATTDPKELPEKATWYLVTNLPHPDSERTKESELEAADLAEMVRLYGLRMWVEQSYKQVKHALGWSDYQVRSDIAIRRHWQLVCCAFSFCWWAYGRFPTDEPTETEDATSATDAAGRGEKEATRDILAGGIENGERVVGALRNAKSILEGVLREAPTTAAKNAA
jgi:DDE superfamily endonuclease